MPQASPGPSKGSLDLGFGIDQYVPVGGGAFLVSLIVGLGWWSMLESVGGGDLRPLVSPLVFVGAFIAAPVVACFLLRARQPSGAKITWDDTGVAEWDGGGLRTFIPWSEVQVHYNWSERYELIDTLELVGDHHERIIVFDEMASVPQVRRRAVTAALAPLVEVVRAHGIEFRTDIVDTRMPLRLWWSLGWAPVMVLAGCAGAGLGVLAVGCAALGIRALAPLLRLRPIRAEEQKWRDAARAEAIGGDDQAIEVRDARGAVHLITAESIGRPHLGPREERWWIVRDASQRVTDEGPYRGGLDFVRAESDGTRTARRDLRTALRLELAVRLSLPLVSLILWWLRARS
jgi:hypothetical protein